jgi:PAS domain S-box-containing protein
MTPATVAGGALRALEAAFPFHFAFDDAGVITRVGRSLALVEPDAVPGAAAEDLFTLVTPPGTRLLPTDVIAQERTLFLLATRGGLTLRGQMTALDAGVACFLGSPWLTSFDQLADSGLSLSDFAPHDPVADFLMLTHAQTGSLADAERLADRLQAESRLLRRAEERFRSLVESSPVGILELDLEGDVRFASPSCRRLTGLGAGEPGALRRLLDAVHPPDRRLVAAAWRGALQDGRPYVMEHRLTGADGTVRDVMISAVPLEDGYLGTVHDLTDIRELERAKDELVASVSHELRTPLTAILAFTELLESSALAGDERRMLEAIGRNAQRLRRLVGEVLVLARADAGRLAAEVGPTDLARLAAEAVESAAPLAAEAGVALQVHAAGPVVAPVDAGQIGQVLDNLVANAVSFTPAGGVVTVEVATEGDEAVLAVADTGPGVAEADLPRLFERFFQTDAGRRRGGGTGLGLAIVRTIADAHGGRVQAARRAPAGLRVTVRLPRAARSA